MTLLVDEWLAVNTNNVVGAICGKDKPLQHM